MSQFITGTYYNAGVNELMSLCLGTSLAPCIEWSMQVSQKLLLRQPLVLVTLYILSFSLLSGALNIIQVAAN